MTPPLDHSPAHAPGTIGSHHVVCGDQHTKRNPESHDMSFHVHERRARRTAPMCIGIKHELFVA